MGWLKFGCKFSSKWLSFGCHSTVGGAGAGREIEKRVRTTTVYDVVVKMDDASTRTVRFEAHYSAEGERGVLRECSRFGREGGRPDGAWLYLEALELSD